MARLGIALDLGTSGFRGQALDLDQNAIILSTAVTTRHPIPGANVMDHLHFAIEIGLECAQEVIVKAVNYLIDNLGIDKSTVVRLGICGNPIQLSLFQGIEIRDLAYAGKRKLEALGVVPPKRDAQIINAQEIRGLDLPAEANILIPPAVRHEVGADALAMMIQSGMLKRDEIAIVTDYGTNAEMALVVNGTVYTGSTAAGPALEGQQIEDGLLALPGAICDVEFEPAKMVKPDIIPAQGDDQPPAGKIKTYVLDEEMNARPGDTVDCTTGKVLAKGEAAAVGITGTGVVAVISQGLRAGLIRIPRIRTPDAKIHLPDGIKFTEKDLTEAGKAIGAVRAGHLSLCQEAGIRLDDIETAYMSGASGTYVDALKAQEIGMIPAGVKKIYQVGNTSLAMARDLVRDVDEIWKMKQIADGLRQHHCMFATSKIFEKVFILELSYWTEGLPLNQYQKFLKKFGLPPLNEVTRIPKVVKTVGKDIPELGVMGLKIISDIGQRMSIVFEGCVGCKECIEECPEHALHLEERQADFEISVNLSLCDGLACRRCEKICKEKVFNQKELFTSENTSSPEIPEIKVRAMDRTKIDAMMIDTLKKVKGLMDAIPLADEDGRQVLVIEEDVEKSSLMGLGKVVNTGVREILTCDLIYVALTNMDFEWGCHPTLILKKGDQLVGEEVRDKEVLAKLTQQKNVWFMHENFVIYKDKISFPKDIMQKNCRFEIPSLPAEWCVIEEGGYHYRTNIFATSAAPGDVFLKKQYFNGINEKGLGTILIGVKLKPEGKSLQNQPQKRT